MGKNSTRSRASEELQLTQLTRKEVEQELEDMYFQEKKQGCVTAFQERIDILLEEHSFVCEEIARLKKGISSEVFYGKK